MWNNRTEESSYCPGHWNRKKGDKEETLDNWIEKHKGLIEKY
jgi:hypothetical protein